jgi:tetratricopeptide (TPR) repeat protein
MKSTLMAVIVLFLASTTIARVAISQVPPASRPATLPKAPPAPPPAPKPDIYKVISDQIKLGEDAQIDDAIVKIKSTLQSEPGKAIAAFRGTSLKLLYDARRYADVAELAQQCILLDAADIATVEYFQTQRILSMLAEGKNKEALVESKRLFNVAGMKGTSDAILIVSQCVNAVAPDDRDALKRFRKEQVEAAASATQPANQQATTLGKIALDSQPYDAAIKAMTAEDYRALVARGNLMLMAGKYADAREVFERAYSLAPEKDLAAATENIARCMKAEDGAIGRANAWIYSLRPENVKTKEDANAP